MNTNSISRAFPDRKAQVLPYTQQKSVDRAYFEQSDPNNDKRFSKRDSKKKTFIAFRFYLLLFFCLGSQLLFSQSFTPGVSILDTTGYVEYIPGNLPVILSAPHGGYEDPATIPDRDCEGCVKVRDSYTQELAREMAQAFFERTGCYPHVVINLLHRKKFDANRAIVEAADGNPTVEQVWYTYHELLDSAKAQIVKDYGRGLFLDLHGHAHPIQRIELGYLLSRSELQLANTALNTTSYIEQSSIQTLVQDNLASLTHAQLLRGDYSLGELLASKGLPTVPSAADPYPIGTDPYFSGGYNTVRHGSLSGGNIDGIQIECNQDIRFDAVLRGRLADSLTQAINEYISLHYNDQYLENYCNLTTHTSESDLEHKLALFPNPTDGQFHLKSSLDEVEVYIFNLLGQRVGTYRWLGAPINIHHLKPGYYWIKLRHDGRNLATKMLIKT